LAQRLSARTPLGIMLLTQTQTRKQKILGDVKKGRRQRTILTTVIIAVLAISIVAGIILWPHTPQDPNIGAPISAKMYSYLSGVSNTTLAQVGSGSGQGVVPMTSIAGSTLTSGNLPEFLYVGAEYCPYCAAERWSMIVALSKFGNFTGLTYMESSATDVYPNTPTFSFVQVSNGQIIPATYSSPYIAFVSVETSDRNGNPLQKPSTAQQALVNQYDCYNGQCGGIAFIDIANKWVMGTTSHAGSQFSPGVLDGVGNWTAIGSLLNSQSSAPAQAVDGAANYLISAICNVDGNLPSTVCSNAITQAPLSANNEPPANTFNIISTADMRFCGLTWRSFPRLT
jgi:hypothetical protein